MCSDSSPAPTTMDDMKTNRLIVLLIVGLCLEEITASFKLPPYITPCAINDPDLSECEKRNGNAAISRLAKGDPAYKIPVLDPLLVGQLQLDDASTAIKLTDVVIKGFGTTQIVNRQHDVLQRRIFTELEVPRLTVNCNYDMNGNFLNFPISASGQMNLILDNVRVEYVMDYDLVPKTDGQIYIVRRSSQVLVEPTGGSVHLTDLLNGNKEIGEKVNQFLNDNFLESVNYVSPRIVDTLTRFLQDFDTEFHNLIPFNELYTHLPSILE